MVRRRAQIAHQQSWPTRNLVHFVRKALEQLDHIRMRPIAVAGQPHYLQGFSIDGND
jgi:hypothetical protein